MKAILILSLAGLATMLTSCFLGIELCPNDQSLGRLKLTNPTFSPYRGNETLTFINQSGNRLTLTNFEYASMSTEQRLVVRTSCYKSEWNKQNIYYDSPSMYASYRQSKTDYVSGIFYSFDIQDLRADHMSADTLWAERLSISNNFSKPGTQLQVLVSARGNLARFDPVRSLYPRLINFRIIPDTLLGGQSYKQVYCSKESPSLFFTQHEGILAFRDEREWWYHVP